MIYPNNRIEKIEDPPVVKIKSLKSYKNKILDLSQGIPWFDPPVEAINSAMEKIYDGEGHRYSADQGRETLRILLKSYLKNFDINCTEDEIVVTPGANQAAFIALSTIAENNDEVLLFNPYYFNHYMALQILGIKPVIVPTDENYHIDPDEIIKKLSNRTKAMIIITPGNPSGTIINKETLEQLIEISHKYGIYIISDEPYCEFIWSGKHISPLSFDNDKCIGLWSFSKSFGMSGWRLGWMMIPEKLKQHVLKIADTLHICSAVPSQILGEEVLKLNQKYSRKFLPEISEVKNHLLELLKNLDCFDKINISPLEGAFYMLISFKDLMGVSGWDIAERILKQYGVVSLPGEPFGLVNRASLRLSYGNIRKIDLIKHSDLLMKAIKSIIEER